MDRSAIERLLPHRAPFLWIDRVDELEPGTRCVARKTVDPAEPLFAGHFPHRPILPGVILIEAVAQAAGVMLASAAPLAEGHTPLLGAVKEFKYRRPVEPGAELVIEVRKVTDAGRMVYVTGTVRVNGEVVAEGDLCLFRG